MPTAKNGFQILNIHPKKPSENTLLGDAYLPKFYQIEKKKNNNNGDICFFYHNLIHIFRAFSRSKLSYINIPS